MKQDPKHWYLLSFMVQHPGVWIPSSFLLASDSINLTIPQITNAKLLHRVPDSSVLIAVSYIGNQTERAINGKPEVEDPSVLTEAYQKGLIAAVQQPANEMLQPLNPFNKPQMTESDKLDASEWQRGFDSVRAAQVSETQKQMLSPIGQRMDAPTELLSEPVGGKHKPSTVKEQK